MIWVKIGTSVQGRPSRLDGTFNPTDSELHASGWRLADDSNIPLVASGYERLTPVTWEQDPNNVNNAVCVIHDTLISDRLARLALPTQFPTGTESPRVCLTNTETNQTWVVEADQSGDILTYLGHASPWPDAAELAARRTLSMADKEAVRSSLRDIKVSLTANKDAIIALSGASFTGDQKTLINALLTDVKNLVSDVLLLRRCVAKLVKNDV